MTDKPAKPSPASEEERHKRRMVRRKADHEARAAEATIDRGVFVILTGPGKGKSSSAFGMVARALGHGMKVGVVQFIKGKITTGEQLFFDRFPEVAFHVSGAGFTWDTQDKEVDIAAARAGWEKAAALLSDPACQMVVLDELNLALKYKHLAIEEVVEAITNRPPDQHLVVTGRSAPQPLIDIADTVSEIKEVKHAYKAGVRAQKGVEW